MLATEAALEKAREYVKTAPKDWRSSICAYVVFDAKGNRIVDQSRGDICHAGLNALGYRGKQLNLSEASVIVTAQCVASRSGNQEKADQAFIKYIVQDSPLSKFIINGDDLSSCYEGGIIIDAAAGHNRTLFIAKALRWVTEERHRSNNWYKLVSKGAPPFEAMIAASVIGTTGAIQTASGFTHAQVFGNLQKIEDLVEALKNPLEPFKKYSDDPCADTSKVFWGPQVSLPNYGRPIASASGLIKGGSSRKQKVPDGWGGYIEKEVGDKWDDVVRQLTELHADASRIIAGGAEIVDINPKKGQGLVKRRKVA